jgi:hypothetical protein
VEGVSTSKFRDVTEALCDTSFSKSFVSELAGSLDSELKIGQRPPFAEVPHTACLSLGSALARDLLRAIPFSSHSPPQRLSREVPALGHGDRCNHDPQRGGHCEGIG